MAIKAKLDLDGAVGPLEKMIDGVTKRLDNLDSLLRKRARVLDGMIQRGFRESRSPYGKAWKPLAPATVARRRKGSSKPLIDTGQLRKSVTVMASYDSIHFGLSGAPATYGPVHQFGGESIPARPFFPIDEIGETSFDTGPARDWYDKTTAAILDYVLHGKRKG